jgi:NADPH:quinone reductase
MSTVAQTNGLRYTDAATFGLPYVTAALGLFRYLGLPEPWNPASDNSSLIIYGASSAVGAYAVKLARLSNIHPVVAIAGRGGSILESILDSSKGDTLIDYRQDRSALIEAIKKTAPGAKVALDSISTPDTIHLLNDVVDPHSSIISIVLNQETPINVHDGVSLPIVFAPALWEPNATDVGRAEAEGSEYVGVAAFGHQYFRYLEYALARGLIQAHPSEIVPGGLNGIPTALRKLKGGTSNGVKYLFRVADTEGL